MPNNFYAITDKAVDLLNERAIKRFDEAKAQAGLSNFDELNVISITRELYQNLDNDNREIFLELAQEKYKESEPEAEEPPDFPWLLALLMAYNAVTKYQYTNEVTRKQQYTEEGINSSSAKATEFTRGLHYWSDMTQVYADQVTDESALKAYRDVGIEKIEWITAGDERVCEICRSRNHKIYPINNIPPKPHRNCRCYYKPVKG